MKVVPAKPHDAASCADSMYAQSPSERLSAPDKIDFITARIRQATGIAAALQEGHRDSPIEDAAWAIVALLDEARDVLQSREVRYG